MKTSFLGAYNMLGLAKRVKARILQASTSEVYGDPDISPQTEAYWGHVNPIGVRSCYDEGKRAAETLFFDYYRMNGVDIRVVRIFNTYGPGMNPYDGRVVSNFIMQALNNEDITIYGDGSQTRSFCFVEDLVEAMIRMMNQDAYVGPINTGNPNEFTIKQLAEKIVELTKSKSKIIYLPLPSDDPKQRRPDITLAKKYLKWEPKVQLVEGLKKTIEYFRYLDMRHFKKPTPHTAHKNTELIKSSWGGAFKDGEEEKSKSEKSEKKRSRDDDEDEDDAEEDGHKEKSKDEKKSKKDNGKASAEEDGDEKTKEKAKKKSKKSVGA